MDKFVDIIRHIKLPFNYNVLSRKSDKWCRYSASFYGYNYDKHAASFNLWMTMDLKTNISVPFGHFYVNNITRSDNTRILNSKSFIKYSYLVQKTLSSAFSYKLSTAMHRFSFYLPTTQLSSYVLSDFCTVIRRRPYVCRAGVTSHYDLDSSISAYDAKFFCQDYRQRSQFF
jgi:hypothetical protein